MSTRLTTKNRKLVAFFAKHPDPHLQFSLADIARAIGATRQFVAQQLPGYADKRQKQLDAHRVATIRAFVRTHPDTCRGGSAAEPISYTSIAQATGLQLYQVKDVFERLGLRIARPHRKLDLKAKAEDQRRRETIILRTEHCIICRKAFPWTGGMEKRRRLGKRYVTCGRACALRARR